MKRINETFDTILATVQEAYDKRLEGVSDEKAVIKALEKYGVNGLEENNEALRMVIWGLMDKGAKVALDYLLKFDLGYEIPTKQIDATLDTILAKAQKAYNEREKDVEGSGEKAIIDALKQYGVSYLKEDDPLLKKMLSDTTLEGIQRKDLRDLLQGLGYELPTKQIDETLDTILDTVQKAYNEREKELEGSGEKAIIDALKQYGVSDLEEGNQVLKKMVSDTTLEEIQRKDLRDLLQGLCYEPLPKQIDEKFINILATVQKAYDQRQRGVSSKRAIIDALKQYGVNDLEEGNQVLKIVVRGFTSGIPEPALEYLLVNHLGHKLVTQEEIEMQEKALKEMQEKALKEMCQMVYERVIEKNGSLNDFTKALKLDSVPDPTLKASVEKLFKDLQKNNGKLPNKGMDKDLFNALGNYEKVLAIGEAHKADVVLTNQIVKIYNGNFKNNKPPKPMEFAEKFLEGLPGSYDKNAMKETATEIGKILASQYPKGQINDNLKSLEAKPDLWQKFMRCLAKVLGLKSAVGLKREFTKAKSAVTNVATVVKEPGGIQR